MLKSGIVWVGWTVGRGGVVENDGYFADERVTISLRFCKTITFQTDNKPYIT